MRRQPRSAFAALRSGSTLRKTGLLALGIGAALVLCISSVHLLGDAHDLTVEATHVGSSPVTVFSSTRSPTGPAVVISHGFAGSQQLMQPLAMTLARNGYTAITFDSLGHGRNERALSGDLTTEDGATRALVEQATDVVSFARQRYGPDVAIIGHSMASDIVVRVASAVAQMRATIAISMFSTALTATLPRNLLVIVGSLEPDVLKLEALRAVQLAAGGTPQPGRVYGSFADGSAREAIFASGVEHIGVLYAADTQRAALAWLNAAFDRTVTGFIDRRGPWLGAMMIAFVTLAYPLSRLLPHVGGTAMPVSPRWQRFLTAAILPAVLTPLILWKLPTVFLPILLGDYLMLHFLLYGSLTAAILLLMRRRGAPRPANRSAWLRPLAAIVSLAAVVAYTLGLLSLGLDQFVVSFVPLAIRVPIILTILVGTLAYFLADEWLTRSAEPVPAAYPITKLMFLLSLTAAVALNLEKLFFLIIIIPVILLLFILYGLFSRWSFHATRFWPIAAVANAIAVAYAAGVTFPLVAR